MKNTPFQVIDPETMDAGTREYVYQVLSELDLYTVPETVVVIAAKDPLELAENEESEFFGASKRKLSKLVRIHISMTTEGNSVESEGVAKDFHAALTEAKNLLLQTLGELQDSAISSADRQAEISSALSGESQTH